MITPITPVMEAVVPAWESLPEGLMAYKGWRAALCGDDGEGDTPPGGS